MLLNSSYDCGRPCFKALNLVIHRADLHICCRLGPVRRKRAFPLPDHLLEFVQALHFDEKVLVGPFELRGGFPYLLVDRFPLLADVTVQAATAYPDNRCNHQEITEPSFFPYQPRYRCNHQGTKDNQPRNFPYRENRPGNRCNHQETNQQEPTHPLKRPSEGSDPAPPPRKPPQPGRDPVPWPRSTH